jgi:hypothetical protein
MNQTMTEHIRECLDEKIGMLECESLTLKEREIAEHLYEANMIAASTLHISLPEYEIWWDNYLTRKILEKT